MKTRAFATSPGHRIAREQPNSSLKGGIRARMAAIAILLRVERDQAFADVLLGRRLPAFAPDDRRLITQLVLGTLAWQGRLDYELRCYCTRELKNLTPELLTILRVGLYQIRILSRIPAYAAVNTAVSIARDCGAETARAAGMVNAVLRRALRQPVSLPERSADEAGYLAVAYSHPRWMVERFVEWFGVDEAQAFMAANNSAAPNVIRLNLAQGSAGELTDRLVSDGFKILQPGFLPESLRLSEAPPENSPSYRQGLFTPQSEASQMVVRMLTPTPGAIVADCAAAPGGKSTHLAELVGKDGRVIACDLNLAGLRSARALAHRLKHRNIHYVRADALRAIPLQNDSLDYVLLDAPCTGCGTLREHPEIRWRLVPSDFRRMARIQRAMLENAARLLRRGGALVYAVCSIAPEEGPEVLGGFLREHRDFRLDHAPPVPPSMRSVIAPDGTMGTRPDRGGLDGFFAARIVRL
jgi:16S rRNA (cytosine967-C5)-methyltransferase